jgi:hypothetical protein
MIRVVAAPSGGRVIGSSIVKRTEENNYGLKIGDGIHKVVDAVTGKRATFRPKLTPNGWTVVLTVGSRKTGRTEHEIDVSNGYTAHQAWVVASVTERDTLARLRSGVAA